ncbi:Ycf66 family protein [Okeania sp.]|uniref:Ycf66 family protein n=1 Tax=Okeania sp. TaxID=3100323 RepID=UPI002B4B8DCE|nr:Ycf66 family protein [Okeania sp.]MEB3340597.1 Ycf66 family protein [Okeania sp.]
MVNLGFGFQALMGVILALSGAGLYFLRTWRPKLARDHDIFFAAIGLLSGGILIFQGWRLDPILAFGQFLLTGTTIFFAAEAISLRGLTTQQARERTPVVDEERSVSSVYSYAETEFDELEPYEEYPTKRRIRGSEDYRSSKADYYEDEYRRPPSRRSNYDRSEKLRKRGTRPEDYPRSSEDWETPVESENRRPRSRSRDNFRDENVQDNRSSRYNSRYSQETATDEERGYRSRGGRSTSIEGSSEERLPRTRKVPPSEASSSGREVTPTEYVEYTPMDSADSDVDNSKNY